MGCKDELATLKAAIAAMVERKRKAGKKGGAARARVLTKAQRSAIARLGGQRKAEKQRAAKETD